MLEVKVPTLKFLKRENPPIIAGLAIGRATLKKIELPLNWASSYKLTGVERKETLDKK